MFENEFLDDKTPKSLAREVDVAPWQDLVRHFAFGRLYVVRAPFTLLEAGEAMKADDANCLKTAMAADLFAVPSEDEARIWHAEKKQFEVLVLDPFVLVAPLNQAT